MSKIQISKFDSNWKSVWDSCATILPQLNEPILGHPVYGSIFVERRGSKNFRLANAQKSIDSTATRGVVLRLYDGWTLWESASDQFDLIGLQALAIDLRRKVEARIKTRDGASGFRPYSGASWSDRLDQPIEPEIRAQIPVNPLPETRVQFAVSVEQDPAAWTDGQQFEVLERLHQQVRDAARSIGLELDAFRAATQLSVDEMLFLDPDVQLFQTLPRISRRLSLTKGKDSLRILAGGLGGMELLEISNSRIESALNDLAQLGKAERLKPGCYSVITSPEVSGVIAHEAFGHAQEGDTLARGRSQSHELRLSATPVGNVHATIWNHPGIFANAEEPGAAWGSYFFDEEGWLAYGHPILDQGKLAQPMTHFLSALQLGVARTANGKRESWTRPVYARQTNTYFTPGISTLDELIQSMGEGYVADYCTGGMEDPKGLGIQVGMQFLREVREGRLTGKLFLGSGGGAVQLTGYTPDVLNSIQGKSKIAADSSAPDQAKYPLQDVGGCGKYHKEFVRAGCGGTYLWLQGVQLG